MRYSELYVELFYINGNYALLNTAGVQYTVSGNCKNELFSRALKENRNCTKIYHYGILDVIECFKYKHMRSKSSNGI